MVKENIDGMMARNTQESLRMETYMEKAHLHGQMVKDIKDNGQMEI